jgi:sirohydrochlorin cobaltochelatase
MKSGIILFAHGARDPQWAEPFQRIRRMLDRRTSAIAVELAFLELMKPSLLDTLATMAARGAERITLVPLFMAQGSHLKTDLPQIVQRACADYPGLIVRTTRAIGEVDELLQAIADWVLREDAHTRAADLGHPLA